MRRPASPRQRKSASCRARAVRLGMVVSAIYLADRVYRTGSKSLDGVIGADQHRFWLSTAGRYGFETGNGLLTTSRQGWGNWNPTNCGSNQRLATIVYVVHDTESRGRNSGRRPAVCLVRPTLRDLDLLQPASLASPADLNGSLLDSRACASWPRPPAAPSRRPEIEPEILGRLARPRRAG